eukprot:NODE_1503_length_882_cov_133.495798_g1162_i0.p1 GENE.NODE_1503_length_882_cov_133.495798_g1162_i0~~NODE_1503_length_882_cov_133.495798_g1162_i0.p1  ORF type:complete len:95 (+),score=15.86 NODE_1503_length_882_cov_133.495798_g1162_i0:372-656(+)
MGLREDFTCRTQKLKAASSEVPTHHQQRVVVVVIGARIHFDGLLVRPENGTATGGDQTRCVRVDENSGMKVVASTRQRTEWGSVSSAERDGVQK